MWVLEMDAADQWASMWNLWFLENITWRNKSANKSMQFWPPNMSKQGVSKLPIAKVGTSHRGMQLFHKKLVESMPVRDD